jgi:hypothetical protein
MKESISKFIYFVISLTLIVDGVIVKYFLVDTNLGARFKNFNHQLLASDIIFICAGVLGLVGLIFYSIKKSNKSTLNDWTVIISAILILPLAIVLGMTPILETIYPGEVGENTFASIIMNVTLIGTFGTFAWIILLFVTFLKQTYNLLIKRSEK